MIKTTLCMQCLHRHVKAERDGSSPTCDAFPEGIPFDIVVGTIRHDHPIQGDNDIQFEPREGQ